MNDIYRHIRNSRASIRFVAIGMAAIATLTLSVRSSGAEPELPVFTDVTAQSGIAFRHSIGDLELSNIVEGSGAGACVFDYNNDGWLDIYFPNGAWTPGVSDNRGRHLRGKLRNALYRNNGDGTFTDVTDEAGVGDPSFSFGASAADIDNDGDLDLYVLNYGPNVLYRNNGDGTFTDISRGSGLDDPHWSLSAPWFDYNGDGYLDVYVCNYLEYDLGAFSAYYRADNFPGPLSYKGQPDFLYRNNGDGAFTDVTRETGLFNPEGRGMSATAVDLDNDGLLDIFVTNDAMANDFFRNQGDGTFLNEALPLGLAFGEGGQGVSSMGPDFADVNRDNLLDVFIPDMDYGCLMLNKREYFEDVTARANVAQVCGQYTGWGSVLFDYDNDGLVDIFVANGNAHHEFPEEDVLLRNNGDGTFTDVAKSSGDYFSEKWVGRGVACGDLDNDGDLDLIVVNLNSEAKILRNDGGNRNHWLMVRPRLASLKRDAVGARVTITAGGRTQFRDAVPVRGYLSQMDPRVHFGLGTVSIVERVEIRWPNGSKTVLADVPADRVLEVNQPE
ncbi:MAG: CRTAC1 family protein [Thermogutta sp.]